MMFKGVLFDLDGVITDTAENHYQAWKNLASKININIDRQFNEQLKGISRMDSLERILKYGNQTDKYSNNEKKELAEKKNSEYLLLIENVTPEDVFPGIRELLTSLKENGVGIVLASASKNGPQLLKQMKLNKFFDAIVNPEDIRHGKPAPDIFLEAAKVINVEPQSCIGIEDSMAGIQSIQDAGALPIGVGETSTLGKDIDIVDNTRELTYQFLVDTWLKHEKS